MKSGGQNGARVTGALVWAMVKIWALRWGGRILLAASERTVWIVLFHRGFRGVLLCQMVLEGMSQLAGRNHAGMQSFLCLRPAFHSFKSVQWRLKSSKTKNVKIAYCILAVQSNGTSVCWLDLCFVLSGFADSYVQKDVIWSWKPFLGNLVMLKFCWHIKKKFCKIMLTELPCIKIVGHKIIFPSTRGKFQDFRFFRGLDSTIKLHQMNDKKQAAGHKLTAIILCWVFFCLCGVLCHSSTFSFSPGLVW